MSYSYYQKEVSPYSFKNCIQVINVNKNELFNKNT